MTIEEALQDVEIAFRNLEFTIKLLSFCESNNINPSDFDTDHLVILKEGNINHPMGNFSDTDSIVQAASVCVSVAFGASSIVLDKAFEVAGRNRDPAATDDVGKVRELVYMVRCAYAHGIAEPRWQVTTRHLRTINLTLGSASISLDLRTLNGQPFEFAQIGGHHVWYQIRDFVVRELKRT